MARYKNNTSPDVNVLTTANQHRTEAGTCYDNADAVETRDDRVRTCGDVKNSPGKILMARSVSHMLCHPGTGITVPSRKRQVACRGRAAVQRRDARRAHRADGAPRSDGIAARRPPPPQEKAATHRHGGFALERGAAACGILGYRHWVGWFLILRQLVHGPDPKGKLRFLEKSMEKFKLREESSRLSIVVHWLGTIG